MEIKVMKRLCNQWCRPLCWSFKRIQALGTYALASLSGTEIYVNFYETDNAGEPNKSLKDASSGDNECRTCTTSNTLVAGKF